MKNIIEKEKLIVIVRGVATDQLIPLAEAIYQGGIRLMEVTFGTIPDKETAAQIHMLVNHFAGKMHIGAGTVLTPKQVRLVKKAGGQFIISPNTDKAVIRKTKKLGLVSIPGAMTPTEVQTAKKAGADFIKLFPVSNLGPDYVKALSAPLPDTKFLAVGGVNETNVVDFLCHGACGVGIGGNLVNKALLDAGDFNGITTLAAAYVRQVQL